MHHYVYKHAYVEAYKTRRKRIINKIYLELKVEEAYKKADKGMEIGQLDAHQIALFPVKSTVVSSSHYLRTITAKTIVLMNLL